MPSDHEIAGPYRFCPVCSGALERRLIKAGEPERLICTDCEFVFYLDPKVAVGTIIDAGDGRVVLIQRSIEPGYGKWVFPGGYVDRGELVEAAAVREAREECGLDVRIDGLINVYSYEGRTPIIIAYAATIVGGTLTAADEALAARLFEASEIPWDQLAFPSTREALEDYFAGVRAPRGSRGQTRRRHG
jgi:ADP-ribose pyrophosphatase YjhB (NUDIX family)